MPKRVGQRFAALPCCFPSRVSVIGRSAHRAFAISIADRMASPAAAIYRQLHRQISVPYRARVIARTLMAHVSTL
ncbi:hypothetical protein DM992_33540 [Burkholderia sp. JP2-270]|nr:hypothetical protein DM992_33540 [Burkholderia sp. JP2-270]